MEWLDPMEVEQENSLCHYGVKGMRWGHHKTSNIGSGVSDALNAGANAAKMPSSEYLKEKEYNSRKNESLNAQRLKNQDEEERKKNIPSKNIIQQAAELCSNIIKNVGNTLISAISSLFKH